MKKSFFSAKSIAGTGLLIAIEVILQIVGNFVSLGPISINLSLVPIAVAAILFGPGSGALLGLINGFLVLLAPSTSIFYSYNMWGTVIVCLCKGILAGLLSGLTFHPFEKKHFYVGAFIVALLVPLINTGIFVGGCYLFFYQFLLDNVSQAYPSAFMVLAFVMIGWNFIFEVLSSLVLSPTSCKIVQIIRANHNE